MTIELWTLLLCALLALALPLIYGQGYIRALGMQKMVGNREDLPPVEGWFSRGKRAHANLIENLIPFAAIVLVAHVAGVHSGATRAGAVLFTAARLVHAAVYIAGIGPLRTLAYGAGLAGTVMIAVAILIA